MKYLNLPRGWKELFLKGERKRLWKEKKRFKVVVAGRRSGKTEISKRKLVLSLKYDAKVGNRYARYFAAAPTRDQAKRIFWDDFKALIPKCWIKKVSESDLYIKTIFGSELWVIGMDRPERVEGTSWDGGVLDEYANMKPHAWSEHIRPALSDRKGWCWFIGVPEGFNHFKDLADYAKSGSDDDWGYYTWKSSEVLPKEEIESARRDLDARTFRQEYEASFEGASGRVYYSYDASIHEDSSITLNRHLPIYLCCDFNVDPCVWEVVQFDGYTVFVVDEIFLRNTNTVEMTKKFLSTYGGHDKGIIVYGDSAGSHRSTTGKSDYALMAELGLSTQRIARRNPFVKDRVNALNSMLMTTNEEVRLYHSQRCVNLRKDFEEVQWSEGLKEIDKGRSDRTHASDALGYFINARFPLRKHKPDKGKKFYK